MAFNSASIHVPRDNPASLAIDHDQVQKFMPRKKLCCTRIHLTHEPLIGTQQELLSGLPSGIERPGHLDPSERSVAQISAIFAREWHALCHRLVDQVSTAFGQPVNICLPRPKISTFNRIVEHTKNRVAIVLVVLAGVDSPLRRNRVSASRGVMKTKTDNVIAQLSE